MVILHYDHPIPSAEYLVIAGEAFVVPPNPPANPQMLNANPTTAHITEANRQHIKLKHTFRIYHAVNKALQNQILEAVPKIYVRSLRNIVPGYSNVTSHQLLKHLWDKYGTITQSELDNNELRMALPWNPPTPIESVFRQLEDSINFASAGHENLALNHVVQSGYKTSTKPVFLKSPAVNGATNQEPTVTWPLFQDHFRAADTDRLDNSTTGLSGYHGANHIKDNHTIHDNTSSTMASIQATIAAKDAQIERLMAAMSVTTKDQGSVFSAITTGIPRTPSPTAVETSYCWTHSHSKNLRHNSKTCNYKATDHQEAATAANTMGGSTRHWGRN
jgi:hypothetical protein